MIQNDLYFNIFQFKFSDVNKFFLKNKFRKNKHIVEFILDRAGTLGPSGRRPWVAPGPRPEGDSP
jgi:hypothetical protein